MSGVAGVPSPRGTIVTGIATIAALAVGIGLWGIAAPIEGAITLTGTLAVAGDRQVVEHTETGIVSEILVSDGDTVSAGEVVVRLDARDVESEIAIVEGRLFSTMARVAMVDAELTGTAGITLPADLAAAARTRHDVAALLDGQRALLEARRDRMARMHDLLDGRLAQVARQIDGLDARAVALTAELDLVIEDLTGLGKLLDAGLTQASRVLVVRREVARIEGEIAETAARRAEAAERSAELEAERDSLAASHREDLLADLQDATSQASELTAQLALLERRRARLDLRAPVPGIVFGLAVTTRGSVLRAAEPALYIIPQDRPLVLVAEVPGRLIDRVSVGQNVRIRVPALQWKAPPDIKGRVSRIDADATVDAQTMRSYYRVEIALSDAGGTETVAQDLRPGMMAEAIIATGARNAVADLAGPLMRFAGRTFVAN
jgi:HlyD family secretion protein